MLVTLIIGVSRGGALGAEAPRTHGPGKKKKKKEKKKKKKEKERKGVDLIKSFGCSFIQDYALSLYLD